ncbi:MAG: UDP-N-acetylglucosamine--N-acetylmuramyl-(pentapeptide) pyrophosphoryl-undecaprenol N-acetylglucosamine transferase [Candidatus Marinamargulisbacteria bacterium]
MDRAVIAFTSDGTGGHVYPVLAVAQELDEVDRFFLTSKDREDAYIVPKYGFDRIEITVVRRRLLTWVKGFRFARRTLKERRVKGLVSGGGFFTLPIVLAAYSLGIPVFLLEQNALPGRVNRVLQVFADRVFLSFEESKRYFSGKKPVVVGNPIRREFLSDPGFEAFRNEDLSSGRKLLVFGGSQGSSAINDLMSSHYFDFVIGEQVLVHITGRPWYKKNYGTASHTCLRNQDGQIKVIILPYFERMDYLYEISDVVLCRAGATSIAELLYFNKPAVLIPYPYAKDGHQDVNAALFIEKGAGIVLQEADMSLDAVLRAAQCVSKIGLDQAPVSNARRLVADEIRRVVGC